jgi:hypothetical protein
LKAALSVIDLRSEILAEEARTATRIAVRDLVEQLTEEFAGKHRPHHVIRQAYRTREDLLERGVWLDIVEATAAGTRRRLQSSAAFVSPKP